MVIGVLGGLYIRGENVGLQSGERCIFGFSVGLPLYMEGVFFPFFLASCIVVVVFMVFGLTANIIPTIVIYGNPHHLIFQYGENTALFLLMGLGFG